MNPTPSHEPDSDYLAEDLRWAVGVVEDWLLHASPETLDELAEFAYGPAHHGHHHLRWITDLLGEAAARLRPAPLPEPPQPATAQPTTAQPTTAQPTTAQPTTAQPATAQPGPSR